MFDINNFQTFSQVEDNYYSKKNFNNKYRNSMQIMMEDIQEFELRKKKENSPKIRILNDLASGMIEASTLVAVIQGLQNTFDGAYNYIKGNGSNLGKIPYWAKEESKLIVTGMSKGSFIVEFNSPDNLSESISTELFEKDFDEIDLLNKLIAEMNNATDYNEISSFVERYGVRTFNYTREWFKSLATKNVSLEYKNPKYNVDSIFDRNKIKDLAEIFSTIDITENIKNIKVSGRLISINSNSSLIEFSLSDGEEIKVKVKDDSLEVLKLTTNKIYNINLVKKEINDSIGKSSVIYEIPTLKGTELETNK